MAEKSVKLEKIISFIMVIEVLRKAEIIIIIKKILERHSKIY